MITADHGCDPSFAASTDHTREYTPLIVYGQSIEPKNFGVRQGFCDISAEIASLLGVRFDGAGNKIGLKKDEENV